MFTRYNKDILDFKCFSNSSTDLVELTNDQTNNNVNTFLNLLKLPEVQAVMQTIIEAAIATSELNILQRLSKLEQILIPDPDFIDENESPGMLDQVSELTQRIAHIENWIKCPTIPVEVAPIEPIIADSKTAYRATLLFNYLLGQKPRNDGEVFLSSRECYDFLKCKLPDEIKAVTSNMQQLKKEVLNKATQLFPNLELKRSKYGNHAVGILLNDSNLQYNKIPIDSNRLKYKRNISYL
jgi:hypothetical protein